MFSKSTSRKRGTSFRMLYPCRTLDTPGTLLHSCPSHVLLQKKKHDTAKTRKQEEMNTLSKNKDSIHAMNSSIWFLVCILLSKLLSTITLNLIQMCPAKPMSYFSKNDHVTVSYPHPCPCFLALHISGLVQEFPILKREK